MRQTLLETDSSDRQNDDLEKSLKPDVRYLVSLTFVLFCATMNFGHALAASNFVWPAIQTQLGPDWDQQQADNYAAILSVAATIGLAVGSLYGGYLIRTGRHKTLVAGNVLVIIGSGISLVADFWTISVGRLFVGIGAGMIMTTSPKVIEETVPSQLMGWGFGISTNMALNSAMLLDSVLALKMPGDEEGLEKTMIWRLIYGIPIPVSLFSLILLLTLHNHDSLAYLIQNQDVVGSMKLIDKIYPGESIFVREELRCSLESHLVKNKQKQDNSVNFVQSLTNNTYKYATLMCIALALFNQFSGVNVITFYSTQIFQSVNRGSSAPIDVKYGNFWLSNARTFGAIFSVIPFSYLPRRKIFIVGHILMGICLGLAYFFVEMGESLIVLVLLCGFMVAFQSSMGSGYFMYIAEVGSEPAMGLSLCTVMVCSVAVSYFTPSLISLPGFGVVDIMLTLALLQIVAIMVMALWMKETLGLKLAEK